MHIAGANYYKLEFNLYKNPGVALGPPVANTVLQSNDLISGLFAFTTSMSICCTPLKSELPENKVSPISIIDF